MSVIFEQRMVTSQTLRVYWLISRNLFEDICNKMSYDVSEKPVLEIDPGIAADRISAERVSAIRNQTVSSRGYSSYIIYVVTSLKEVPKPS